MAQGLCISGGTGSIWSLRSDSIYVELDKHSNILHAPQSQFIHIEIEGVKPVCLRSNIKLLVPHIFRAYAACACGKCDELLVPHIFRAYAACACGKCDETMSDVLCSTFVVI
jgi:hypothetical protein